MTCWQCGAALPPDVGFCRACGALVRPRSVPVVAGSEAAGPATVPRPSAVSPTPVSTAPWPVQVAVATRVAAPTDSRPNRTDPLVAVGSGFVLLSVFLTWYSVTITALGVRFYDSLEQAFLSKLFPQAAAGLGGLKGPLTTSVGALGQGAGGWRWAILVVSIVVILETLVVLSSGGSTQSGSWPHGGIQLLLTVANAVLVLAAFFTLPYDDAPSVYITVSRGAGAYLGLVGALFALACALATLLSKPSQAPS